MDNYGRYSNVFYRGPLKKTYPRIIKGEGVYLYDDSGKRYLDAMAGIAVVNIGYGVNEIAEAMAGQAKEIPYVNTLRFTTESQEKAAEELIKISSRGMTKVYYSSSGTEANETALKLARQYHIDTGNPTKYKVISRWQSYHGNTIGSLSMSGHTPWRQNYVPYLLDFPHIVPCYCYRCPFKKEYPGCDLDCAWDLERVIKQEGSRHISAFIAESIGGGTAGVLVPPPEYYKIIRDICDRYNILFIADEIMCGIGRTGRNFAIDHYDVVPDMIGCAKGIGAGYVSLAATIVHQKVFDGIYNTSGRFVHGYTYSGNPISCATSVAVLRYLEKNKLIKRAAEMGEYLMDRLNSIKELDIVGEIRGKGLFIGIEFVVDKKSKKPFERSKEIAIAIANKAMAKGLLIQPGSGGADGILGDHILIAPPFIIKKEEIDDVVNLLKETLKEVQNSM